MKKAVRILLIVLAIAFIAIQFVRPARSNPPVNASAVLQPPPEVQAILKRSCYDCHSSETRWPWYSNIAPVSWWLKDHVDEGRKELSFSLWNTYSQKRRSRKLEEICDQVTQGEMPPKNYLVLHSDAKISDADRRTLYDQYGHDGLRSGGYSPHFEDFGSFSDLFGAFFGSGGFD
ncbi:MAG: heme-binding domain-containing protein, partial [Acidobacteriota bacterium]|nr:heme-binding domain-containing protein [Acidobacteriota bacterium]